MLYVSIAFTHLELKFTKYWENFTFLALSNLVLMKIKRVCTFMFQSFSRYYNFACISYFSSHKDNIFRNLRRLINLKSEIFCI